MMFEIFLIVCNVLLPILMLVFGIVSARNAPKKINNIYGYRTRRSMLNQETWEYAHAYFGRLWKQLGGIMLPISILLSLPILWIQNENMQGVLTVILESVQIIVMIGSIFLVERALEQKFDEQGNKREPKKS